MRKQRLVAYGTATVLLLLGMAALVVPVSGPGALKRLPKPHQFPEQRALPEIEIEQVQNAPADTKTDDHKLSVQRRALIESVELDKKRACPGETVLATVSKKRDIKNPVHYNLPGHGNGSPAIVSFDEPGEQTVHVVANDGVGGLDFKSVELEILNPASAECAAKPVILVAATVSNLEADVAEVRVSAPRNLGDDLRYTYEFGDGTSLESSHAYVTHNYQLREQDEPMSSFVIKVRAEDEKGKTASGRASVAFRNTYWLSTVVGSPMIPVFYNRFAQKRGSTYETNVTFKNIEKLPVTFSTATVTLDSCSSKEPTTKSYSADRILSGLSGLAAAQSHSTKLTLPEADVVGACRVVIVIEGDTVPPRAGISIGPGMSRTFDTTRAQIALDLVAPPLQGALPAAAPVEVSQPGMLEKLEKAEAILGKDRPISPEDLKRLEKEGRLN